MNEYLDMFLTFSRIGALTFGGGYAMLPMLQKEIVERKHWAEPEEIDRVNILRATMNAMRRAVEGLGVEPDCVWVDGNRLPDLPYPAEAIVKGDAKVPAISAASILAKTARDAKMREYAEQYPEYGFERHAGYGTKEHVAALEKFGPTPIHRKTFEPVKSLLRAKEGRATSEPRTTS